MKSTCLALFGFLLIICTGCTSQKTNIYPLPLAQAHSHNDYEHSLPLHDALQHGFCSVEADIYLIDGKLLVAHDRKDVKPEKTLQALYLDPLRARIKKVGTAVYPNTPVFTLLIDIKSDAAKTYHALDEVLSKYADILVTVKNGKELPGPVRVIISGSRAPDIMAAQPVRYAALDGRLTDLDSDMPAHLMPWISDNAGKITRWNMTGPFPEEDRKKLTDITARAHKKGRKVRLWATPDDPAVWDILIDCKVDIIGTDDLAFLESYLRQARTSALPE